MRLPCTILATRMRVGKVTCKSPGFPGDSGNFPGISAPNAPKSAVATEIGRHQSGKIVDDRGLARRARRTPSIAVGANFSGLASRMDAEGGAGAGAASAGECAE